MHCAAGQTNTAQVSGLFSEDRGEESASEGSADAARGKSIKKRRLRARPESSRTPLTARNGRRNAARANNGREAGERKEKNGDFYHVQLRQKNDRKVDTEFHRDGYNEP